MRCRPGRKRCLLKEPQRRAPGDKHETARHINFWDSSSTRARHVHDLSLERKTPILITAQAVVFGTSAAVPLQRRKTTHWLADATRVVTTSMPRIFHTPTRGARRARKRYPSQYGYIERARAAREIDRL